MRAELWTAAGGYVAGFDLPPFKVVPDVVLWGDSVFALHATGFADSEGVHLNDCRNKAAEKQDPPLTCTCGGAFAFTEVFTVAVQDMQRIEKGRDKPITK